MQLAVVGPQILVDDRRFGVGLDLCDHRVPGETQKFSRTLSRTLDIITSVVYSNLAASVAMQLSILGSGRNIRSVLSRVLVD